MAGLVKLQIKVIHHRLHVFPLQKTKNHSKVIIELQMEQKGENSTQT